MNVLERRGLPSASGLAATILEIVDRPEPDAQALQMLVECDPVLAAKIIRAGNEPGGSKSRSISTLPQAIRALGVMKIQSALLTFTLAPPGVLTYLKQYNSVDYPANQDKYLGWAMAPTSQTSTVSDATFPTNGFQNKVQEYGWHYGLYMRGERFRGVLTPA